MASGHALPPPQPLDIHDTRASEKWKRFKLAWENYARALELDKKSEAVQVATLLTVIEEEARDVFSTFKDWVLPGDEGKIKPVMTKFKAYCQPRKNVPFEHYRFNRRTQEPGKTYDQYRTALRKLAEGCDFESTTPDEILRNRLVFGIKDSKVKERLLRESKLTLEKTDEICRAAESMLAQMKVVEDNTEGTVSAVQTDQDNPSRSKSKTINAIRECGNCGRKHDQQRREFCPAYGKVCNRCSKLNHFAVKCRSGKAKNKQVQVVDEDKVDEVFPTEVAAVSLHDSHLVTLKLESGSYLRFQVDTEAQCNVIPLELYKKATKDTKLAHNSA